MVSKLALALILFLLLAFLLLAVELLYVLCYRRRFRRATSPPQASTHLAAAGLDGAHASKELLLYFLFHSNQASDESPLPAAAASTACDPPKSEKRDVEAACQQAAGREVVPRVVNEEDYWERGALPPPPPPLPIVTPCGSPSFYTPMASPPREASRERRRAAQPEGIDAGGMYHSPAEMALELINA